MKFREELESRIDIAMTNKKKATPYMNGKSVAIGIGVGLISDPFSTEVYRDGNWVCGLDELSRMIEELTMLKEAIEEEAGIIL